MPLVRVLRVLAALPLALAASRHAAAAQPLTALRAGSHRSPPHGQARPRPTPVPGVTPAPQHPFMAPNPKNNVHNDAWMTDNYTQLSGPLGRSPESLSTTDRPRLHHADLRLARAAWSASARTSRTGPRCTCSTRTTLEHARVPAAAVRAAAGGHQPGDQHDRRRVLLPRQPGPRRRRHRRPADPRRSPRPTTAGSPAFQHGRVLRPDAVPAAGRAHALGAARQPGPAVVRRPHPRHRRRARPEHGQVRRDRPRRGDRELVRDRQGWRLHRHATPRSTSSAPARTCKPRIVWRATYRNTGEQKPGQFNAGSGTTPTLSWGSEPNARQQGPGLRGDHRQRRPARRRRLPGGRQARPRREARRVPGADLQQGRQRGRELAHRHGPELRSPRTTRATT